MAGSQPDTVVYIEGVTVLGPTNLPAQLAPDAGLLYARNVAAFLALLLHDSRLCLDSDDALVTAARITPIAKEKKTAAEVEGEKC